MRRRRSSSSSCSSSSSHRSSSPPPPTGPTLSQLELELEASADGPSRLSFAPEHQFSSSHLRPFYAMSEQRVDAARQLYQRRAHQRLQRHLSSSSASPTSPPLKATDDQWKLVKELSDLRVYRLAPRRQHGTTLLAQGVVRASLSEIMDGLYAETTKEARVQHALLSDAFVDTQLLHVDSYRTAQHPFQFSGVSWFAMATPQGYGVCRDRDFLCFKRTGTFSDDHGHDVGYMTLQSLDATTSSTTSSSSSSSFTTSSTRSFPTLPASQHFVRGFLNLAVLFRPLPNGVVSLFLQADFDARGRLPARLADKLFVDLALAISNAGRCGQAKSLAHMLQSTSAGAPLPPGGITSRRDRCGVCARTLWRVLATPEFCRSCWTRTCRRCRVSLPIYCADFHRAHDSDPEPATDTTSNASFLRRWRRRLTRPCHETFCAKCACSVVPFGIKLQHEKKKKLKASMPSHQSPPHSHHYVKPKAKAPHATITTAMPTKPAALVRRRRLHATGAPSSPLSSSSSLRRQVLVTLPPPSARRRIALPQSSSSDARSSISVLSSVESEKHQRYRLSLTKPSSRLSVEEKAPTSMLEVLESFQLSHALAPDDRTITDEDEEDAQLEEHADHRKVLVKIDLATSRRRRARASRRPTVSSSGASSSAILSSVSVSSSSTSSRRPQQQRHLQQHPQQQKPSDEYYHRVLQRVLRGGHSMRRASFGVDSAASISTHDLLLMDVSESSRHDDGTNELVGLSWRREDGQDAFKPMKVSTTASVSSATSSDRICSKYLSSLSSPVATRPPAAF